MFAGIVEEVGRVTSTQSGKLAVSAGEVLREIERGGSIAVNGVCLTVTGFSTSSFSVDIMLETLRRTNLGLLSAGGEVNLERPLTLQKPLGGHLVQGHVGVVHMTCGEVEPVGHRLRGDQVPIVDNVAKVGGNSVNWSMSRSATTSVI